MAKSSESAGVAPKPRKRRTYMPAAERRKSIIAAAQGVFAERTLQGARTRDIAAAANVNQATIFEHFESKEALFQAAVVEPLIEAMKGMHSRVQQYERSRSAEELAEMARPSARRHMEDMIAVFPLFTSALFSDPDLGRQLYREHIAPVIAQRGDILRGLTRDELSLDFVGLANFGMLFAVAMDRHFGDDTAVGRGDIGDLTRQFTTMATGGFARDHQDKGEKTHGDPT